MIAGVVQLLGGEHRAGVEVVPQAERMADLVHDDLLDHLAEELLGELARPRSALPALGEGEGGQAASPAGGPS